MGSSLTENASQVSKDSTARSLSINVCVLLVALSFPTFVTWIYFVNLHGQSARVQQVAYGSLKAAQFLLPVFAVLLYARADLWKAQFSKKGISLGVGFGVLVTLGMIAIYGLIIRNSPIDLRLREMIEEKLSSLGMASRARFIMLGAFYSIIHSGLEEYYWRWFVFRWAKSMFSFWKANALASVGFMLHHILVLGFFFGFEQWQTWFCAISIAVGGSFWAWLYNRTSNLVAIWLSHALVDAGIFLLGYTLIGSSLS